VSLISGNPIGNRPARPGSSLLDQLVALALIGTLLLMAFAVLGCSQAEDGTPVAGEDDPSGDGTPPSGEPEPSGSDGKPGGDGEGSEPQMSFMVVSEPSGGEPLPWGEQNTLKPLLPTEYAKTYAILLPSNVAMEVDYSDGVLTVTYQLKDSTADGQMQQVQYIETDGEFPAFPEGWAFAVKGSPDIEVNPASQSSLAEAIDQARQGLGADIEPTWWELYAQVEGNALVPLWDLDFSDGEVMNHAGDQVIRGFCVVNATTGEVTYSELSTVDYPGTVRVAWSSGSQFAGWSEGNLIYSFIPKPGDEAFYAIDPQNPGERFGFVLPSAEDRSDLITAPVTDLREQGESWTATPVAVENPTEETNGTAHILLESAEASFTIAPWMEMGSESYAVTALLWLDDNRLLFIAEPTGPSYGDWWTHYGIWLCQIGADGVDSAYLGPAFEGGATLSPNGTYLVWPKGFVTNLQEFIDGRQ